MIILLSSFLLPRSHSWLHYQSEAETSNFLFSIDLDQHAKQRGLLYHVHVQVRGFKPSRDIFPRPQDEVKVAQSCLTLCDPMDSSVHGILEARILEWVAFPFSRGSSQPRDQTQISHTAGRFFTSWATREAHSEKHCYIFFLVKTTGYLNKTVYYIELSFFPFRSEYKYYNSREIIGKWDC